MSAKLNSIYEQQLQTEIIDHNKYLISNAGVVWMFAVIMVIKTGLPLFINQGRYIFTILFSSISIFSILFFHNLEISRKAHESNKYYIKRKCLLFNLLIKSHTRDGVMLLSAITIRKYSL